MLVVLCCWVHTCALTAVQTVTRLVRVYSHSHSTSCMITCPNIALLRIVVIQNLMGIGKAFKYFHYALLSLAVVSMILILVCPAKKDDI